MCSLAQRRTGPDHHSHMAYAVEGRCLPSHPVPLPALEIVLRYRDLKQPVVVSSGGVYSGHADFINTWEQIRLSGLVGDCPNELRFCGGG
jgi:Domain of unknown function (DUF1996)